MKEVSTWCLQNLVGLTNLLWRVQFLPTLSGMRLLDYVDGSSLCQHDNFVPPSSATIAINDGASSSSVIALNPEYIEWQNKTNSFLVGPFFSYIKCSCTSDWVHHILIGVVKSSNFFCFIFTNTDSGS